LKDEEASKANQSKNPIPISGIRVLGRVLIPVSRLLAEKRFKGGSRETESEVTKSLGQGKIFRSEKHYNKKGQRMEKGGRAERSPCLGTELRELYLRKSLGVAANALVKFSRFKKKRNEGTAKAHHHRAATPQGERGSMRRRQHRPRGRIIRRLGEKRERSREEITRVGPRRIILG